MRAYETRPGKRSVTRSCRNARVSDLQPTAESLRDELASPAEFRLFSSARPRTVAHLVNMVS